MSHCLAGRRIVITRPVAQAQAFAQRVREAGGEPVLFPLLEIAALEQPDALQQAASFLREQAAAPVAQSRGLTFFVSPNAVRYGVPWLQPRLPAQVAAVGMATAAALEQQGIKNIWVSPSFDSEGLLALPPLQSLSDQRCLIVRGQGGRPLLGDTLRARGAYVHYASAYWRAAAPVNLTADLALDAVVITSSEALNYWLAAVRTTPHWFVPVFASHPRIMAYAQAAQLPNVFACTPGDAGIVAALCAYFGG